LERARSAGGAGDHEGRTVVEVAAQASHAPTMTLSTYAHVIAELEGAGRVPAETQIPPHTANTYPFRTRRTAHKKSPPKKSLQTLKPSAGVEPATPSLPWQSNDARGCPAQSQSACNGRLTPVCNHRHQSAPFGILRYRVSTLRSRQPPRFWLAAVEASPARIAAPAGVEAPSAVRRFRGAI
jgi:hypothetical protein